MEYYFDERGDVTIDEIVSIKYKEKFVYSKKNTLNFGFNTTPCWVRFQIYNPFETVEKFYLEIGYSHLDSIDLYLPENTGGFIRKHAGDQKPFSTDFRIRDNRHMKLTF